ncbi:murein transglycosylase A [Undibacter mobilis]|uniref:peptidoglycan lytic exotransglycosylase n=1 Tax=Undibacter mobilis TaxID=2292256 RepID=A0A371B983_9BRAD|nr:MltA domain-containing protein [Undibacter mobilis]RDV04057.1 lytic transglycosylase [Undibacter mobilis]
MPGGGLSNSASVLAAACFIAAIASPANAVTLPKAAVEPVEFAALTGWDDDDHAAAYAAFLKSCGAIRHGTPKMRKAKPIYGGLYTACTKAIALGKLDRDRARDFFEQEFRAYRVAASGQSEGFFTGYYEPEVQGSRTRTEEYKVPVYTAPLATIKGKVSKVFGHLDRTQIEEGALAGKGLEICWVKNPVDVFFAQIQGSTRVRLDDGKTMRLNYIASNGHPYTPVGRFLIDRGIIAKEDMSMDRIRDWMEANPEEGKELRRKNRSFVFFQEQPLAEHEECIGAQGVPLTPLRSVAVDKSLHVYGTPIWIDAELPIASERPETPLRRLMIAQDTGSAIVGPARADIYFGYGNDVGSIAGRVKQFGRFVMLVPREVTLSGSGALARDVPLPKPRPGAIVAGIASRP